MASNATTTTKKLDLVKTDKNYYTAPTRPQHIRLETMKYVAIQGVGSPDGTVFAESIEALYTVAYGVKAICKANGQDFAVPKLEGQWWVEDERYALEVPREEWHWKLLIRLPEYATPLMVEQSRAKAAAKKKDLEPIARVAHENILEGDCVQMLHVGPYSAEPESIEAIRGFMREQGWAKAGLHHEIYLSDPRRSAEAMRKTIIRYPVAPVTAAAAAD